MPTCWYFHLLERVGHQQDWRLTPALPTGCGFKGAPRQKLLFVDVFSKADR